MGFAGFSDADLANYLGLPPEQGAVLGRIANGQMSDQDIQHVMQWQTQKIAPGGSPSGALDKWGDIQWGLSNLGAHPQGSKVSGGIGKTLGDIGLNFATGGFYGAGKAASDVASGNQNIFGGAREGFNQLGPWGSTSYTISPQVAERGNIAGLGAGAGAVAFGGTEAAGTMYGPEGIPILTDPSTGFAAQGVGLDASGLAIPGAGMGAGSIPGAFVGGAGAFGPAAGSMAAQQLASVLTPNQGSPQLVGSAPGASAQGLSGQQMQQLGGGGASDPHKGLAYPFEKRQRNRQEDPGIAALYNIGTGA